ncbi:MAG: hypothetical protein M5U14_16790 [Acidimicrobiia bacterium]|nr:hypothetical protein [Acidimicrobiia bacterium]
MLFVTTYRFRDDLDKDAARDMMKLFAEKGTTPGTRAHYVWADGGGGLLVEDITDATTAYEWALAYSEYMDLETRPVITVDEALPKISDWLG